MAADDEDFWDDLLAHIRQQVLVPVAGPDLTVVQSGDATQVLTRLVGQRLIERYHLTVPGERITTGQAVAAFLRERGRDEAERLYRVISDIIAEVEHSPGDPLRDLAAIADFRLFVSTTPDRLLAQAVNEVRYNGNPLAHELAFSPNQSTTEQSRNIHAPADDFAVVLRLFGGAASTPQYAIHEEDRLEWLHALLSDPGSLPDWLAYPLKHQPLLFIGCDIPDWLGRFLLRLSSINRLSLESKQFFIVHSPASQETLLSDFFSTYCRKAQVQQLEMEPAAFVAELRARWERVRITKNAINLPSSVQPPRPDTIFISYIREDADIARRLQAEIASMGGNVWMDERRLLPGDSWEDELLAVIRREVRLFIPLISANTEHAQEGYVFREWDEAVERSRSIPGRRFVIPVIVDGSYAGDTTALRQIPEEFRRFHFGRAPAGYPDSDLSSMLTSEIREMRRRVAA
jgi:hypothetical protein